MSEDKKTFVSRHGRRTAITADELVGILDDEPALTEKKTTTRKKQRRTLSRRTWVIIAGIIVVLLLIPVIIGEVLTASYNASTSAAQSDMKTLITTTVQPLQKKASITSASIADIATKTEAIRDRTCSGGVFDNMATLYPRAKHAYDQCIAERSKVAQVANAIRDVEKEASYLQAVSPLLSPLLQKGSGDFAVISSQLTNWQDFQTKLKLLSPPPTFRVADTALKAAVKQVVDGWSALNTASSAQDAKGFTDAQASLAKAYQAVRDSTAGFDSALTLTQKQLSQTADQL